MQPLAVLLVPQKLAVAFPFVILLSSSPACSQVAPVIDVRPMILTAPPATDAPRIGRHRPDFSGHWTAVTVPDAAAPVAHEIVAHQRTLDRRIVLNVDWRGGRLPRTHSFVIGGEMPDTVWGAIRHYAALWDDDSLVIDEDWSGGTPPSVAHRERWSLDSQGRLSVTVTHRAGNERPVSAVVVYRRQ